MATIDTKNDTSVPTIRIPHSVEETARPFNTNLPSRKRLAPNITGIARKKEYSAATSLELPRIIPPRMVEPERDVPGMMERA